jgi:hypothetical protein
VVGSSLFVVAVDGVDVSTRGRFLQIPSSVGTYASLAIVSILLK